MNNISWDGGWRGARVVGSGDGVPGRENNTGRDWNRMDAVGGSWDHKM